MHGTIVSPLVGGWPVISLTRRYFRAREDRVIDQSFWRRLTLHDEGGQRWHLMSTQEGATLRAKATDARVHGLLVSFAGITDDTAEGVMSAERREKSSGA